MEATDTYSPSIKDIILLLGYERCISSSREVLANDYLDVHWSWHIPLLI